MPSRRSVSFTRRSERCSPQLRSPRLPPRVAGLDRSRHGARPRAWWRRAGGRSLEAEPESREWAFAAYVASLDAEEASAAELAALSPSIAV